MVNLIATNFSKPCQGTNDLNGTKRRSVSRYILEESVVLEYFNEFPLNYLVVNLHPRADQPREG